MGHDFDWWWHRAQELKREVPVTLWCPVCGKERLELRSRYSLPVEMQDCQPAERGQLVEACSKCLSEYRE